MLTVEVSGASEDAGKDASGDGGMPPLMEVEEISSVDSCGV